MEVFKNKEQGEAMRFLSIHKTVERNTHPSQQEMAKIGTLIAEGKKAGRRIATEGCLQTALGARAFATQKGKL